MATPSLRGWVTTAVFGSALLILSCGKSGPKLYPVRGKVSFQGSAPEGASVVFHLAATKQTAPLTPSGVVGKDGSFTLTTYPHGEGAPAGEYVVIFTWYPADARASFDATNKLPARYADPNSPKFKATIKEGPNELEPFQLTK